MQQDRFQRNLEKSMITIVILFLAVTILTAVSFAQEKISLQAEGQLVFDITTGNVYAEEGVELEYQDLVLLADSARYDSENRMAYLVGNVELIEPDRVVRGQALTYDFTSQVSYMDDVRTEVTGTGMQGLAYLTGQRVTNTSQVMHIDNGTITTCDLEDPHYHLASKSIDIYPGDRIVVRHVVYYEGKIPLFYWPYLVIPIRKTAAGTSVFEFPRVGRNESDGWYVKTAYNYYRGPEAYGKVHLDWFQKKGIGKGVDHTYQDDEQGYGEISLYHLGGSDWGQSITAGWTQQLQLGQAWEFASDVEYVTRNLTAGDSSDFLANLALSRQAADSRLSATLDYEGNAFADDTGESDLLGRVSYSRSFGQGLGVRLGADLRRLGEYTDGASEIEQYEGYLGEITLTQPRYQVGVALEQKLNPEFLRSEIGSVKWVTAKDAPRLFWRSRNWRWFNGYLPMLFTGSYSRYSEVYPNGSTQAGQVATVTGGINNKVWNLNPQTRVTLSSTLQQDWYRDLSKESPVGGIPAVETQGDLSRLSLRSRSSLRYKPSEPWTLTLGYTDDWVIAGETPFVRDQIDNKELLTGRVQYQQKAVAASLSTGYDFYAGKYEDVVGQLGYRPSDKLQLDLQANYDVQLGEVTNLYTLAKAAPLTGWQVQFGSGYDLLEERWERLDAATTAQLPWGLTLQHLISYDGATDSLTYNDIALTKDLHCRELTLRYSAVREEIWLEFSLNAFPRTKLLAGTAEDKLLFDAQGIEELVDVITD
ncbi:MAG: LPS-assembly protein LptD [Firmicutes bacterium]|nr:LPS-assembly protein LptD [Bacillota bacterium]